jgi:hypothetical protein
MRTIAGAIAALAVTLAFAGTAHAAATLKADYRLENSLKSSVAGAPALTNAAPHPCAGNGPNSFSTAAVSSRTVPVLDFQRDGGLIGPAAPLIPQDNYSIAVEFEFSATYNGGWRRVIDLSNGTSDAGLYVSPSDLLDFYPLFTGVTAFTNTTWHQVVLTRDAATNTAAMYLDGNLEASFADTGSAALAPINTVFFQDNQSGGAVCESSDGAVARIRLYKGALSASQVSALTALPPEQAIGLSATSGAAGSTTTVSGSDFGPMERVTIKFKEGTATKLVTVKTDHTGAFSDLVTIPAGATAGAAHIIASGHTSTLTASTSFTVTP